MPLSPVLLDQLLKSCNNVQERLLVLLLRDLEGRSLEFGSVGLSDFDRVSGALRITSPPDGRSERVRLGQETVRAFHDYVLQRKDKAPALFVDQEGRPLSENALRTIVDQLAHRSGLEFNQANFRFRMPKTIQGPRLVAKGASKDLFYLYGIVSHPLRRRIVELLGDEGPQGFTQIKKRLDVRVGTLYYHFDMLAGLIKQDPQKRYMLTEAGKDAYHKLRSPEYVESSDLLVDNLPATQGGVEKGLRLLLPSRFLSAVQSLSPLTILGAAIVLGLGSFSAYQAELETVVLFLNPSEQNPLVLGLGFLGNWLLIFAVADGIATFVFGRKGEHFVLLLGSAYALVPLLAFIGWWDLASALSLQAPGLTTIAISRIVLVGLQAWSLALMARIVSVLKGLRLDKAAVISLTLAYLSIMIAYVRGL